LTGGLVATRAVDEWVLGHVEPMLTLSLGKDNPSAMSAGILPNHANFDKGTAIEREREGGEGKGKPFVRLVSTYTLLPLCDWCDLTLSPPVLMYA
jgi:hypothetical protein